MTTAGSVGAVRLTVEGATLGAVVMTRTPRLSWATETAVADWRQASAEVVWTTASEEFRVQVAGDDSRLVAWPFAPLEPGQGGTASVRVEGADGGIVAQSEPVEIICGVAPEGVWDGHWVFHPAPRDALCGMRLRRAFTADKPVARAVLFATAHGVYQAQINGRAVDDERMKPGWTAYGRRDTYATTDVTALVEEGSNEIHVDLARGWFGELYGFQGHERLVYDGPVAFAGALRLEFEDGSVSVVHADGTWEVTDESPIRSSGIYAGEEHDSRVSPSPQSWVAVGTEPIGTAPAPRSSPPVRAIEELAVVTVVRATPTSVLLDFGQNLVGHLRITVAGPAGHTVTLRHAEVLEDSELSLRPLRRATAIDRFTLAGGEPQTWEPQFTFHGFRYAELLDWPGEFDSADVAAIVVHSDMRATGSFETSHALLNRLHANVEWSMRGNFLSIPTDCPQRDERLGWTGDLEVFAPTASFLYDCNAFLTSWLADLAVEQAPSGSVPFVVPDVLSSADKGAAAWGDAATVVPWTLYERFGDRDVLEQQFASMCGWVDYIHGRAGDDLIWAGDFQFGDWLDPSAPPDRPADAKADKDLIATAYFYRSADLTARAAAVLGRSDAARTYRTLADAIRDAWQDQFLTPAGRLMSDAQTAYAAALAFGLVYDVRQREVLGARLAALVELGGNRIGTGFVGTPIIADALTSTGHIDVAARLVTQTENPSWLYPVTMGATTIWERWDSMLEDGTVNPGEMTSFNHYALGAVADWLQRVVGGLAPASPGYQTTLIAPHPIADLTHASTSHLSAYGTHTVEWNLKGPQLIVRAVVPPNTTASVELPGREPFGVGAGEHRWVAEWESPTLASEAPSVDGPLTAILRDPEAYAAVKEAFEQAAPEAASATLRLIEWSETKSLGDFAWMFPPGAVEAADQRLQVLSTARRAANQRG